MGTSNGDLRRHLVKVRTYGVRYDGLGKPGCEKDGDLGNG
jgi:hypothetical protein